MGNGLEPKEAEHAKAIQDWWILLTRTYRTEVVRLSEAQRQLIRSQYDFGPPFSVDHVWIKKPESQIAIVSRFDRKNDERVIVHGPLNWSELPPFFDALIREPRWARKLVRERNPPTPSWAAGTAVGNLAAMLALCMRNIEGFALYEGMKPQFIMAMRVTQSCSVMASVGDILAIDAKDEALLTIDDAILRSKPRAAAISSPETPVLQAYSTVFYPPVTIESEPTWTDFPSLVSKGYLASWNDQILTTKFGTTQIGFQRNGEVTVAADEIESARDILNTVFGVAALEGVNAYSVRLSELKSRKVDRDTFETKIYDDPRPVLRETVLYDKLYTEYAGRRQRTIISRAQLARLIARAEEIYFKKDLAFQLTRWMEARTYFENSEYGQSFIMSWIAIERDIYQRWEEKVPETKRMEIVKLDRSGKKLEPSVSLILHQLKDGRHLQRDQSNQLFDLNDARNQFVHSGEEVSKEVAVTALSLARLFVEDALKQVGV